ncbi:hypothetical protein LX73_0596 [Fodinibius salinus]|uniref:Uncharacterized protein n=1 Tax=Fodinibius salinus TaxID=860790 RepID=A0A5D3YPX0_9BACT|nr:hypothetical protein LX73_0596 [Fodinibius salinus]
MIYSFQNPYLKLHNPVNLSFAKDIKAAGLLLTEFSELQK